MKVLHTADWHLGRTLHGDSLELAVEQFFDWLVGIVDEQKIDLVLVAGDIYDRGVPPLWAVRSLSCVLKRLSLLATVVLIPGNHDSATRLGFGSALLQDNIKIVAEIDQLSTPIEVKTLEETALVYAIPYLDPDLARHQLATIDQAGERELPERSHQGVMSVALQRINTDLAHRLCRVGSNQPGDGQTGPVPAVILMGHAFMAKGLPSDSERNIEIGGAAVIPSGMFSAVAKVDYVALGHLHRPQEISGSPGIMRYSGSPIALSFSEAQTAKSVAVFTIENGEVGLLETFATPVYRPLAVLSTTINEIEDGQHDHLKEHWLSVAITDSHRPTQMVTRVRQAFPHALNVFHSPDHVAFLSDNKIVTRDTEPLHVAQQFFEEIGGRQLTSSETLLVEDVLSRARQGEK